MPIYGETDTRRSFFPRIAKIRLGMKKTGKGGAEYPTDMDHFVLTDCPEVAKVYGEKPRSLVVMFPSDEKEEIFPTGLEAWKTKGRDSATGIQKSVLFCCSDGRTATRIYAGPKDTQGHELVQSMPVDERPVEGGLFKMPCPHEAAARGKNPDIECPYFLRRDCKRVGRLNVVLPEITFSGTYQIETSSSYGFGNIEDMIYWALRATKDEAHPNGWVEFRAFFDLVREPVTMHPEAMKGKTTVHHVLNLRMIDDDDRIKAIKLKFPAWMRTDELLLEGAKDRPVDLFPLGREEIPAIPETAGPDRVAAAEIIPEPKRMAEAFVEALTPDPDIPLTPAPSKPPPHVDVPGEEPDWFRKTQPPPPVEDAPQPKAVETKEGQGRLFKPEQVKKLNF